MLRNQGLRFRGDFDAILGVPQPEEVKQDDEGTVGPFSGLYEL